MQGIARGNYPPTASPFTHSTPNPWGLKANTKALKKKGKKGRKKKKGGPSKKS